jgi:hypothetical protein
VPSVSHVHYHSLFTPDTLCYRLVGPINDLPALITEDLHAAGRPDRLAHAHCCISSVFPAHAGLFTSRPRAASGSPCPARSRAGRFHVPPSSLCCPPLSSAVTTLLRPVPTPLSPLVPACLPTHLALLIYYTAAHSPLVVRAWPVQLSSPSVEPVAAIEEKYPITERLFRCTGRPTSSLKS